MIDVSLYITKLDELREEIYNKIDADGQMRFFFRMFEEYGVVIWRNENFKI